MTGSEVSVEIMVINGDVNVLAITDKLTTGAPHFVEMGHSQQTRLDIKTQEEIKAVATKAAKLSPDETMLIVGSEAFCGRVKNRILKMLSYR